MEALTGAPTRSRIVGSRSVALAWTREVLPAGIFGPLMRNGIRTPPSHTVPLPFESGALYVVVCCPWSDQTMMYVFLPIPSESIVACSRRMVLSISSVVAARPTTASFCNSVLHKVFIGNTNS